MDAIKQQLLRVQQQLTGLSASQKMLTASLLVIMVMTLFYWSHFAGTSEMVAVIDKAMSVQELTDVKNAVSAKGIAYEVRNDRVYVPIGKKSEVAVAMSDMALEGKLPKSYDEVADQADEEQGNPLESQSARQQRMQDRRRRRVESMMSRWPDVVRAEVIIAGEKRIGITHGDNPTASISMTVKEGADVKKIVQAARTQVTRAQPGLKPEDVGITVNGRDYKTDDANNPFGGENGILAARNSNEKYYVDKILKQLQDIPGVRATVSVDLDTKTSVKTAYNVDPKNKVEALKQTRTSTEENGPAAPAGEPGMTANVGDASENATAAARSSTVETNEQTNEVAIGYVNEMTQSPAGNSVVKTASVGLPESYFRRIWKSRNPKAQEEPTEADIQLLVDRITPDIRAHVRSATAIMDDKLVSVSAYFDFDPTPVETAGAALAAIPMTGGFGAKEIAVGALAVISLFMVSMMVRKSAPPTVVAVPMAAAPAEPGNPFLRVQDLAGEVGESTLTLTGQELSDDAIEAKQVIEQVGTMVKQNPEVAANLIKRWLNQD